MFETLPQAYTNSLHNFVAIDHFILLREIVSNAHCSLLSQEQVKN
jgi:hypothetical protein